MASKSETNLHEYMCEYGWLIYCHDGDDVLYVHCVYKTEDGARRFLKETPYFNFCSPSERDDCIKFKIKRVEIKTIG